MSLEAGGAIPCRPNPAATLLVALVLEKDETRIMKWRVLNVEASQRKGERKSLFNALMGTLKPQSNAPLYSNTVIGTLAVDG